MIRIAYPLAVALLLLAGCSADLSQEAKTATVTYTAVSANAASVLKADVFPPKIEACIKAADTVAYNYQNELNQTAQQWIAAGSAEKSAYEKAFDNLEALFSAGMLSLTDLLAGKGVC